MASEPAAGESSTSIQTPTDGARRRLLDELCRLTARTATALPRYSAVRLFQPRMRRVALALGAREFTVETPDGLNLAAMRLPAQVGMPGRLPIVYVHGFLETKEVHLREAVLLTDAGHDVILFDMRAHGRSGGRRTTFGVRERADLRAVIDRAQTLGYVGERVVTIGFSLGGATVLAHAAEDQRVAGVAALAPFVDGPSTLDSYRGNFAPWLSRKSLHRGFDLELRRRLGFTLGDLNTVSKAEALAGRPVMIVVGQRDHLLPAAKHARAAATAIGPWAQYIEIPDAGHMDLCPIARPAFDQALTAFACAVSDSARSDDS